MGPHLLIRLMTKARRRARKKLAESRELHETRLLYEHKRRGKTPHEIIEAAQKYPRYPDESEPPNED